MPVALENLTKSNYARSLLAEVARNEYRVVLVAAARVETIDPQRNGRSCTAPDLIAISHAWDVLFQFCGQSRTSALLPPEFAKTRKSDRHAGHFMEF